MIRVDAHSTVWQTGPGYKLFCEYVALAVLRKSVSSRLSLEVPIKSFQIQVGHWPGWQMSGAADGQRRWNTLFDGIAVGTPQPVAERESHSELQSCAISGSYPAPLNKKSGLRPVTIGNDPPAQDPELEALVRTIIDSKESYYTEFKTAWDYGPDGKRPRDIKDVAKDIGEAVVAFANSEGGDLLVGVEDSGRVTGIPWVGDKVVYLLQAHRNRVKHSEALGVTVHEVSMDGHHVLLLRVPEYNGPPLVTSDGRCLWRSKAASVPVPPEEIARRRTQKLGDRSYEALPVPQATVDDIELPAEILAYRPHLRDRDLSSLLKYWNLVEGREGHLVLRKAALLLFAKDPLRWHPNNRLRVRRSAGNVEGFGRLLNTREVEVKGPIVKLLREARRVLQSGLRVESRTTDLFSTAQILPSEAVDECIVNAVAHRNYAIEGSAVEIILFPDRVEFKSPGRLPEPLTVEDLRQQTGAHRSRNPIIMRVLRDLGWTRDQGEGIRRIFGSMSQVELHEPELEEAADTFVVRLSTQSLYDQQTQAWIAAYGPFGLEPHERKYMVAMMKAGGSMSVDRLARSLSEGFDDTKKQLANLDKKGLVWHAPRSRNFHLVQPLLVPHELAYRRFARKMAINARTTIDAAALEQVIGTSDTRSAQTVITRLKENGILVPAGSRKWKFGASFLQYVRDRS